jgi:hypothetical protein
MVVIGGASAVEFRTCLTGFLPSIVLKCLPVSDHCKETQKVSSPRYRRALDGSFCMDPRRRGLVTFRVHEAGFGAPPFRLYEVYGDLTVTECTIPGAKVEVEEIRVLK